MSLYAAVLDAKLSLRIKVEEGRCAYVHIARGEVNIDGQHLQAGDAFKLDNAAQLEMLAVSNSEVLWFDLPPGNE